MAPADWGGAEEAEKVKGSRPRASTTLAIAALLIFLGSGVHSYYPLTTMYPNTARRLADPEDGHLMAPDNWGLGGAEGAEEAKESRPLALATLLAILGAHGGHLLMTMYRVLMTVGAGQGAAGRRPRACAVASFAGSATTVSAATS